MKVLANGVCINKIKEKDKNKTEMVDIKYKQIW